METESDNLKGVPEFTIILFYKYVKITDTAGEMVRQRALCERLGLKGRMIIAEEGINATLEGETEATNEYMEVMKSDERFADIHWKKSVGTGSAFPKLKIKVRPEIVSLHLENDLDPNQVTGTHLKPEELKRWFEEGRKFVIVDMRNDYEFKVGKFKDSIMPPLKNFRDLQGQIDSIKDLKDTTVLTVCTGGVRCEKASGLLVREGFKDVYQLDGGIVSYMEKYPAQEFEGTLYVFDNRITMDFDTPDMHKTIGKCDFCESKTEQFYNCAYKQCNLKVLCCDDCFSKKNGEVFCSDKCRVNFGNKKEEIRKTEERNKESKKENSEKESHYFIIPWILQKIGYVLFWIVLKFFLRIEINGKENIPESLRDSSNLPKGLKERRQNTVGNPVLIFAANHASEFDPSVFALSLPFMSPHFPLYFVANPKEKFKTFGWRSYIYGGVFFNLLGAYPIISGKHNYEISLQHHLALLRSGKTVCIFPEGGRTKNGNLLPGHGGVAYLSHTTRSMVVPIAINTFFDLDFKTFFFRRRKVVVNIGKPMRASEIVVEENPSVEDFKKGGQKVMERIGELMEN
jgi:UPF0176 protein